MRGTLEPPVADPNVGAVQVRVMAVLVVVSMSKVIGLITRGGVSIVAPEVLISDKSPHPSALCARTLTYIR